MQTASGNQEWRRPVRKLQEVFGDFLNPETVRKLADIERTRNRERAERRAEYFHRTESRLEIQRKRDNRTNANTNTTGQPFFYFGKPAQSNPEATDGRKIVWKNHGRQREETTDDGAADENHQDNKTRPPPAPPP